MKSVILDLSHLGQVSAETWAILLQISPLWRYLVLKGLLKATEKFFCLHTILLKDCRTIFSERIPCISTEVTVFIMNVTLLWLMSVYLG